MSRLRGTVIVAPVYGETQTPAVILQSRVPALNFTVFGLASRLRMSLRVSQPFRARAMPTPASLHGSPNFSRSYDGSRPTIVRTGIVARSALACATACGVDAPPPATGGALEPLTPGVGSLMGSPLASQPVSAVLAMIPATRTPTMDVPRCPGLINNASLVTSASCAGGTDSPLVHGRRQYEILSR